MRLSTVCRLSGLESNELEIVGWLLLRGVRRDLTGFVELERARRFRRRRARCVADFEERWVLRELRSLLDRPSIFDHFGLGLLDQRHELRILARARIRFVALIDRASQRLFRCGL